MVNESAIRYGHKTNVSRERLKPLIEKAVELYREYKRLCPDGEYLSASYFARGDRTPTMLMVDNVGEEKRIDFIIYTDELDGGQERETL